jgi:hypothetical protein
MNGPHPPMRPLGTRQDLLIPLPKTIPNHCMQLLNTCFQYTPVPTHNIFFFCLQIMNFYYFRAFSFFFWAQKEKEKEKVLFCIR